MTEAGFARALRSFAQRVPFEPYWLEFQSGDRLRISHPEAAQIRGNLVLHVAPNGRQRLFDCESICQLLDEEPK
jgi:hypothetical protein